MADNLWHEIAPLEEEADKLLEDARSEAADIIARARQEAGELSESNSQNRIKKLADAQVETQDLVSDRAELSRLEAGKLAEQTIRDARQRMDLAADAVVERILDTRGDR